MTKTALILGVTGSFGGAVARALGERGVALRVLARRPGKFDASLPGMDWRSGDAMNEGDVIAAAEGADIIVHAVNPPAYKNWKSLALPMLENTIAAARAAGARILFPGTVYNFGPDAGAVVDEASPQHPQTRKGQIRVRMEQALARASEEGVGVTILRAGDYFGAEKSNSWFSGVMVKPGQPVRQVTWGNRGSE
jgi:nucleoside-diphosphate-sugar epimerase